MRRLLLLRHGESRWNAERRVQGQAGTGLSARGQAQAEAAARVLARRAPGALLFSSDLRRCVETVAPLARLLARPARAVAGLRERDFGAWTGRLASDLEREDPQRWQRWRSGEDVLGEAGGESTAVFTARVVATVTRLVGSAPPGATVLCVTHGGTTWNATRALLELPRSALGGVANASLTELVLDGRWHLRAWNQRSHLPLELR